MLLQKEQQIETIKKNQLKLAIKSCWHRKASFTPQKCLIAFFFQKNQKSGVWSLINETCKKREKKMEKEEENKKCFCIFRKRLFSESWKPLAVKCNS